MPTEITFKIKCASVVSLSGPDDVRLDLVDPVHGEYEEWNTSALYVKTARGNGEACLFELGWRGEYTYIKIKGAETRKIEDWCGTGIKITHEGKNHAN
jgi:hypothetical protein